MCRCRWISKTRIRRWPADNSGISHYISYVGDFFRAEVLQKSPNDLRNGLSDLKNDLITKAGLSDKQADIVLAMGENKYITQKQLSEMVGITDRNIRKNLKKLKELGFVQRIGPLKGGYWKISLPWKRQGTK
jgi:predicted HTH transcriptional regulator